MLLSIAITTLLWADLSNRFVGRAMVTLGFAIGWVDDYRKVVRGNPKGWARAEAILAGSGWSRRLRFALPFRAVDGQIWPVPRLVAERLEMDLPAKSDLIVPFFKNISYPLGVFGFIALSFCVIVGASNAGQPDRRADGLASCRP